MARYSFFPQKLRHHYYYFLTYYTNFWVLLHIKVLQVTPDYIWVKCFPPTIQDFSFPIPYDHPGSHPNLLNLVLFCIFNKNKIIMCEISPIKFNKNSMSEYWAFKLHPIILQVLKL